MVPQMAQRSAHLTAALMAQMMAHQTAQLMGQLKGRCWVTQTAHQTAKQTE